MKAAESFIGVVSLLLPAAVPTLGLLCVRTSNTREPRKRTARLRERRRGSKRKRDKKAKEEKREKDEEESQNAEKPENGEQSSTAKVDKPEKAMKLEKVEKLDDPKIEVVEPNRQDRRDKVVEQTAEPPEEPVLGDGTLGPKELDEFLNRLATCPLMYTPNLMKADQTALTTQSITEEKKPNLPGLVREKTLQGVRNDLGNQNLELDGSRIVATDVAHTLKDVESFSWGPMQQLTLPEKIDPKIAQRRVKSRDRDVGSSQRHGTKKKPKKGDRKDKLKSRSTEK